jgi:hypothetical protein
MTHLISWLQSLFYSPKVDLNKIPVVKLKGSSSRDIGYDPEPVDYNLHSYMLLP